jgi:hypothetical protein
VQDRTLRLEGWHRHGGARGLGAVLVISLVFAGRSLGAVTPHLAVASSTAATGAQTLTISVSRQMTDDQVGRIQLFVPAGFTLNSPPPPGRVGTTTVKVRMRDLSPSEEQLLSGSVVAIDPTDPTASYEGANCDTNEHLAAWIARVGSGRTTFSFPIFVDATSGTAGSFGQYVLVLCFRSADLPQTDPARSAFGAVVDSLTLKLTPFTAPTVAGGYLWRSLWTPFATATGTLDPTANVEAQSNLQLLMAGITIDTTKTTMTLRGSPLELVVVSGRVLVDGQPQPNVLVRLRSGARPTNLAALARVRTGSDGVYLRVAVLSSTRYFQASADLPISDSGAGSCAPSFESVPCLDVTTNAGHVASPTLLLKR